MSNAKTSPAAEEKISTVQIKNVAAQSDPIDFDNLKGESFVGLNLLDLTVGQADGPFVVNAITEKEFGVGKNKKLLPQYMCKKGTTPVTMPISASFLTKAKEAKLDVGDTFYIKREKDFTAKDFGTDNCKSYILKVTSRAS
jgi:hypothetical protein